MTEKAKTLVASLGNGFSIAVGPWREIAAGRQVAAASGAAIEPPTEVVILPYPVWELEDITIVTDDLSQELMLADIRERQLDIVWDYHHQSLTAAESGIQAIASGWSPWRLIRGGKDGLVSSGIGWTPLADGYLRNREFRYFSPVVLVDEKTLRATTLLSVALTNTPRTNKQPPLTAQLAASLFNARHLVRASREIGMNEYLSILITFLNHAWYNDDIPALIAAIEAALAALKEVLAKAGGSAVAASAEFTAKLPQNATLLDALVAAGLKMPAAVSTAIAAAATLPGSALAILDLPATTTEAEFGARLIQLQATTIPVADHERIVADLNGKIAVAQGDQETRAIDALFNEYADRLTPVVAERMRPMAQREYRASSGKLDALQLTLQAMPKLVAASQADNAPPEPQQPPALVPQTAVIGGEPRALSADGAEIEAANRAILAEKAWGFDRYAEANDIRKERERVAAK